MSIKEWIKWDYSEVEDPSYKNELKADRFLGITLFFVGVISFLCLILQICGVFNFDSNTEMYIFFSLLIFFSLSGSLIAYLTNGKRPYVKFALMFDLVVIAIAADMFLAFYAVLILAIPFVCSSKYSDLKICKNVGIAMCVLVLLNGFIAFFTNVQKDINILSSELISKYAGDNNCLTYWEYTVPVLLYSVLPKELFMVLLSILTWNSAKSNLKFAEDETKKHLIEQRVNGELSFARTLQESLLPTEKLSNVTSFDIAAKMIPAKEVGGDMYDYFLIDDQHLAIVIGDVSGKGVAASLFMGMTKAITKNTLFDNYSSLGLAISKVNDMIVSDNKLGLFVTSWIGILDLNSGELTYVNAGHNFPILYKDNKVSFLKEKSGMAIGVAGKKTYTEHKITLKPNDKLIIYTDGATDAVNQKEEFYGEDRFFKFVEKHIEESDDEIVENTFKELNSYQEGKDQFDDITIVSLTFKSYLDKKNVRREFVATVETFAEVSEFIEETLMSYEVNLKYINQMNIAVEEIFTNIAKYGFKGTGNGKATVDITFVNGIVTVTTYDNSPKFDTFAAKEPDITLAAEDRKIGGLGILMVRRLMDEVSYKYENGMNVISLVKKVF